MEDLNVWQNFQWIFADLRWWDLLDLLIVWLVIYRILIFTKSSGLVQILSGLGVLFAAFILSQWWDLVSLKWLLDKFFNNLFLILVILFQGEIRRALAQIGSNPFLSGVSAVEDTHILEELSKGAIQLAQRGYGALIVIEKEIKLDYFIEVGIVIDANVRSEILTSFFDPTSPLHDGATIIREGRIHAAGCFLPLSKNPILDKNLGTRHRAAIGLTEETDAIVLVVSEETNSVSLVQGGDLTPDVDQAFIRRRLYDVFGLKMRKERRPV